MALGLRQALRGGSVQEQLDALVGNFCPINKLNLCRTYSEPELASLWEFPEKDGLDLVYEGRFPPQESKPSNSVTAVAKAFGSWSREILFRARTPIAPHDSGFSIRRRSFLTKSP